MDDRNIYSNSNSDVDTWPEAVEVAEKIHIALFVGSMNDYFQCYIRRSYGPMKENGNISKREYMMGQYSKYVRADGSDGIRVDATEIPENGVYFSAFKNTDGTLVIFAVNNRNESYSKKFNVKGFTVKSVTRYRKASNENLGVTINMELIRNGFWAQLNSKTLQTFVIS